VPGEDVEAAARLEVQVDQRHQHQQRAGQRVQEELERRVDARGPPQMPMMMYIGISVASKKT
jgi:hypothetical protein